MDAEIARTIRVLDELARKLLREGASREEVLRQLRAQGLEEMQARLAKAEARHDILHGVLIAGFGVLFSAVTYSLASSTGGVYVVTTGVILVGLGKVGRGLMNL
jgi:hypothetical protein